MFRSCSFVRTSPVPIPATFQALRLPAIAAPLFLISGPDLVVAVCKSGLVGTFPALNQRTTEGLADWMAEIAARLDGVAAPWGVNLLVHRSNTRFEADLAAVVAARAPLVITSLGAVADVVDAVHAYGGLVFHDVVSRRHAEKAAAAGVDGIIAVAAGAGGHGGTVSPMALVAEVREVFAGTVVLGGAISNGAQILAARAMGADLAYLGTRFIATREAQADPAYKEMLIDSGAADIVLTAGVTGIAANFLRPSLAAAGIDPAALPAAGTLDLSGETRAWKTIWSAGHGVGAIGDVPAAAVLCDRLAAEYATTHAAIAADPFAHHLA